ncbi:MAG: CCA tRNA nucleotidyltransferase, partial [Turicibacter sp.]
VMMIYVPVEVTTFRTETDYTDYRHPNSVGFTTSLIEDLKRRDFTMNAIASNQFGKMIDPHGGLKDIKDKTIRAVGDPYQRFTEDPLRMLRGIRFVSKLDFEVEAHTYEAMIEKAPLIAHISKERIKRELYGVMEGVQHAKAIRLWLKTNMPLYIDHFNVLLSLKGYHFERLNHPIQLFCLVGYLCEELTAYLKDFPFSREEKKMITQCVSLLNQPTIPEVIIYQYGEDIYRHVHALSNFLNFTDDEIKVPQLLINTRQDIEIDAKEIVDLVNKKGGAWLQHLLQSIEINILTGQLINEKTAITEFIIKEMGQRDEA